MPLGPFNMYYGFGASPILVDGIVVLAVDQDTAPTCSASTPAPGRSGTRSIVPASSPAIRRRRCTSRRAVRSRSSFPRVSSSRRTAIEDGHRVWWVRGLACEMKSVLSIEGDTA